MGISAPFFTYNAEGKATGSETREVKALDFKSTVSDRMDTNIDNKSYI